MDINATKTSLNPIYFMLKNTVQHAISRVLNLASPTVFFELYRSRTKNFPHHSRYGQCSRSASDPRGRSGVREATLLVVRLVSFAMFYRDKDRLQRYFDRLTRDKTLVTVGAQ